MRHILLLVKWGVVVTLLIGALWAGIFLRAGQEFQIQSASLDEPRSFSVYLPEGYGENTAKEYPIVYSLDGEKFRHGSIMAANATLLVSIGLAPEVIIVAVHTEGRRGRDYRPSIGAEAFTQFIRTELMTYVNHNFRSSGYNVISGHSHGGLYAVYAFAHHPGLFDAHIAMVPSLYYERGILEQVRSRLGGVKSDKTGLTMVSGLEGDKFWQSYKSVLKLLENTPNADIEWREDFFPLPHPLIMLVGQMVGLSALK